MTYYNPYPPQRPARRGVWLLLGIVSIIATVVLVWWIASSAPSMYVRDEDGVWRPRINEDYRPDVNDRGASRVLAERQANDEGVHEFVMHQADGVTPVAFSPCAAIQVEINYRKAPDNGQAMTREAIAEMESLTGLKFEIIGETDREVDFERMYSGQEPVLVSWADRSRLTGRI